MIVWFFFVIQLQKVFINILRQSYINYLQYLVVLVMSMKPNQKKPAPTKAKVEQQPQRSIPTSTPVPETIQNIKEELNNQILQAQIQSLTHQIDRLKVEKNRLEKENKQINVLNSTCRKDYATLNINIQHLRQNYTAIQSSLRTKDLQIEQKDALIKQKFDTMISTMDQILKVRVKMEEDKLKFDRSQQDRKKNNQFQELQRFKKQNEETIKRQEDNIKVLSETNESLSKQNIQNLNQINQLKLNLFQQKKTFDDTKSALQNKYKALIEELQKDYKKLSAKSKQEEKSYINILETKQAQIDSLLETCSEKQRQVSSRIQSQGKLVSKKEQSESKIQQYANEIERLKKLIDKHKIDKENLQIKINQKDKQLLQKEQNLFKNKIEELSLQFKKKFEDLNLSYNTRQSLHLNKIKAIEQQKLTVKDNFNKRLQSMQNHLQKRDSQKISYATLKQNEIKRLQQQKSIIKERLGTRITIIEQIRKILFNNSSPSQNDQQIPSLLKILLDSKTQQNLIQKQNNFNLTNQITALRSQFKATKSFMKSVSEEINKIKRFSDLASTKDRNLSNYETTSDIKRFIEIICNVQAQTKDEGKVQKSLVDNIRKQLSKSEQSVRTLTLTKEHLSERLQKMNIQNQNLTQQLIKIKFDNQIVVNNLTLEMQSLQTVVTQQTIRIEANQGTIKNHQDAFTSKNKDFLRQKEQIKFLKTEQSTKESQFDSELKKISKLNQDKQEKIKAMNATNQQLNNRIKQLQNQSATKQNEANKLNEQLEKLNRESQESLQLTKKQLNNRIKDKQRDHNQYIEQQIRRICVTLGEVFEKQPKSKSFNDIIDFIKNNSASSSDTTLSVSPILQKMPKERAYLAGQIRKFLQARTVNSTFLYKYDKINNNFLTYLPVKTNNFSFLLLMKTKKSGEVFGVLSEGMEKKALAFNLTRMATYQPAQDFSAAPTTTVSRYLFFGNKQIKVCSSPNSLDVAVFTTIYGDRCFSFNKADVVGNGEDKENVALESLEIHQINI